jgi:predicted PurR-regulated permease PerM
MLPPSNSGPTPTERGTLLVLLAAVSVAMACILVPLYGTILWGAVIAMLFTPLYRRLLLLLNQRRTAAALATLLAVLLMVVLPLVLIAATLAREAADTYARLQSGEVNPLRYLRGLFEALPPSVTGLLDRFGVADFGTLQQRVSQALAQASQFIATQALAIGQNTFELLVELFITMYLAFFLIRDGEALANDMRRAIPLAVAHRRELFEKFTVVVRATVKGNLVVAALQGLLGGLAFWFLDVDGALLWAVVMAFLSLLPAVGAALVWAPVALYFFLAGDFSSAAGLAAWGVLVIGLVDNLLRPLLVGKDTRLPDYLVLTTTLGGMAVFGINGFVLGPAIAAMFVAVWHIYGSARETEP